MKGSIMSCTTPILNFDERRLTVYRQLLKLAVIPAMASSAFAIVATVTLMQIGVDRIQPAVCFTVALSAIALTPPIRFVFQPWQRPQFGANSNWLLYSLARYCFLPCAVWLAIGQVPDALIACTVCCAVSMLAASMGSWTDLSDFVFVDSQDLPKQG
jgi:hypothetical protein